LKEGFETVKRILVIDDDPAVLRGLEILLRREHFEMLSAKDGETGYSLSKHENVDLIILDLLLPKLNGEEVCKRLRSEGITTPVLMLTSKNREIDEIIGLEIGADDYVSKPFSNERLIARLKSLLRRTGELHKDIETYAFGDVEIDFRKREFMKINKPARLSVKEFEVLKYLILHESEVVSRDALLRDVWGYSDEEHTPTTRTVDNYILSLRHKIERDHSRPKHLLTIHTQGYKFVQ